MVTEWLCKREEKEERKKQTNTLHKIYAFDVSSQITSERNFPTQILMNYYFKSPNALKKHGNINM